jgi:CHAD domain-containing protein
MNITVYAETSASSHVTEEIAAELHEFRVSVRRGRISLDVAGQRLWGKGRKCCEKMWKNMWKEEGNLGQFRGKQREELDL